MHVDESLLQRFTDTLNAPPPPNRQKEQVVQNFLESNSELIPTPNRLNHHLHFQSIVSKFPLGTELTTDYVYITKSSDVWIVTLVEIESPDKEIFTGDTKRAITTAAFNAALDQVRSWKHFVSQNSGEVLRRLEPLLQPAHMRSNPVEYHYQLIVGRSENKNKTDARKQHFRLLQNETGIQIIAYDQLVEWYRNDQRYKKNVLRLSGFQYEFKHMQAGINHMLSFMTPGQLALRPETVAELKGSGYDMDAWFKGELLAVNGKLPLSKWGSTASKLFGNGGTSGA